MGAMYKEIIYRRRLPVFIVFFAVMTIVLYLLKIAEIMELIPIHMSREIDLICLIAVISFGVYGIRICQIQYKYSIIGEQFIIHKIKGHNQKIVEDIRIQDIEYIGLIKNLQSNKKGCKNKKYICSLFNLNKYCCIYDDGGMVHKVWFEPSSEFIEKIKCIKSKQKFLDQQRNMLFNNINNSKVTNC